jgi:hypothetical protein
LHHIISSATYAWDITDYLSQPELLNAAFSRRRSSAMRVGNLECSNIEHLAKKSNFGQSEER